MNFHPPATGSNVGHRSNIESLQNNTSDDISMNVSGNVNGSQGVGNESSTALSTPNNMGGSQSPLKNDMDEDQVLTSKSPEDSKEEETK